MRPIHSFYIIPLLLTGVYVWLGSRKTFELLGKWITDQGRSDTSEQRVADSLKVPAPCLLVLTLQ